MAQFLEAVTFGGSVTMTNSCRLPAGTVDDRAVSDGAAIAAGKLVHRHQLRYQQAAGVTVVSATEIIHLASLSGSLKAVRIRPITAPTGGDLKFTVNVEKAANGSDSWTALLDAVVNIGNTDTSHTIKTGTLAATPTYSANDAIRVEIVASGATGTQGLGVVVEVEVDELGI